MKKILMYMIPNKTPYLKQYEGENIIFKKDLNENQKNYLLRYYNKLGKDFYEKYREIEKYNQKDNKLPIFLDNGKIHFIATEDNYELDL